MTCIQFAWINTRQNNMSTETVNEHERDRDDDLAPQFFDTPDIFQRLYECLHKNLKFNFLGSASTA